MSKTSLVHLYLKVIMCTRFYLNCMETAVEVVPSTRFLQKCGCHGNAMFDKLKNISCTCISGSSCVLRFIWIAWKLEVVPPTKFFKKCGCHSNTLYDTLKTCLAHLYFSGRHVCHLPFELHENCWSSSIHKILLWTDWPTIRLLRWFQCTPLQSLFGGDIKRNQTWKNEGGITYLHLLQFKVMSNP